MFVGFSHTAVSTLLVQEFDFIVWLRLEGHRLILSPYRTLKAPDSTLIDCLRNQAESLKCHLSSKSHSTRMWDYLGYHFLYQLLSTWHQSMVGLCHFAESHFHRWACSNQAVCACPTWIGVWQHHQEKWVEETLDHCPLLVEIQDYFPCFTLKSSCTVCAIYLV